MSGCRLRSQPPLRMLRRWAKYSTLDLFFIWHFRGNALKFWDNSFVPGDPTPLPPAPPRRCCLCSNGEVRLGKAE